MTFKGVLHSFLLEKETVVITGGAGLLGWMHASAVIEAGGVAVLWDINGPALAQASATLVREYGKGCCRTLKVDITSPASVNKALRQTGRVDVLINNAANNPTMSKEGRYGQGRLENFDLRDWEKDIAVGLTGAFLCAKYVGAQMAAQGSGVILNIASDLGVIAPDQRIYKKAKLKEKEQAAKPVTYSVVKHGIIGLTKYLATYWAHQGVRVNALSPGGIYAGQDKEFVRKLGALIPLGRMAREDEYKAAVLFLISKASSYMTGANLIVDGGRTCW